MNRSATLFSISRPQGLVISASTEASMASATSPFWANWSASGARLKWVKNAFPAHSLATRSRHRSGRWMCDRMTSLASSRRLTWPVPAS